MNLLDISQNIKFDEASHTYTDENKKILTSVTQCLGSYKTPFDETGVIALMCGRRKGITKEAMQAEWKETNRISCEYGHNIHSQIEYFLKTGNIQDTPEKDIIEDFSKIKFNGEIFSELRLKSSKFSLAGTCDIATLVGNTVSIHDAKSNKRFDFKSKYNKKFFYPINNLDDSHINAYSLQILIYGEMVKEHGFDFKPGQILWINPETRKIEKFDVLDLTKEVSRLLNHFSAIQNF